MGLLGEDGPFEAELVEELGGLLVVGQGGEGAVGGVHGLVVEQGDEECVEGGGGEGLGEGGLKFFVADGLQVALLLKEGGEGEGVGIVGLVDEGIGGVSG